jgi:thymidylate synthase
MDQLEIVLDKLKKNPSTRHGVIMMWDPSIDLIVPQLNVPCPYTFTLNIIGGRLHLHLIIRSNDMILGFPTDVAGFALLTHILAQRLNVRPGILTVSISNAHIYENQMDAVRKMKGRRSQNENINFMCPLLAYERATVLDESLVDEIKNAITGYTPHEPIKGIPIAI